MSTMTRRQKLGCFATILISLFGLGAVGAFGYMVVYPKWGEITSWLSNSQAWLAPGPISQMLLVLAVFFLIGQALPNDIVGGKLFERKGMWVSSTIAAVLVVIFGVLPYVAWQLVLAIVVVAVLVAVAFWARNQ